jgi:F0F1-type ATP synthase membrane subunit b/b'
MLLHLILMAEAASSQRLPKALLSAPKPLGRTHVELRLENWRAEMARARRKQEKAARKAIERAERQARRQQEAARERARIERRELRKSCLNQYPVTVVRIRRRLPKRPSAAEIPGARDAFRERVDAPGQSESQA